MGLAAVMRSAFLPPFPSLIAQPPPARSGRGVPAPSATTRNVRFISRSAPGTRVARRST